MSKIEYTNDDKVVRRDGEFYKIGSCYTTPRSVHSSDEPGWMDDPMFAHIEIDVDELTNKPRRFFDHLLSVMEYKRDHDPSLGKGNVSKYYDQIIKGCEMWLSAVENGLYGEVEKLATPVNKDVTNA